MLKITNILGINKLEYLNYKTDQFNSWCTNAAEGIYIPKIDLQTNAALLAWFSYEWDKQINYFYLPDIKEYLEANIVDPEAYQKLFVCEVVTPIQKVYPSAIIDRLKKAHYAKINSRKENSLSSIENRKVEKHN